MTNKIYTFCVFFAFLLAHCLSFSAPSYVHGAEKYFEVQGVSRPMYNATLSFSVPGSVFEVNVVPGQTVKKGTLLMHLDSRAEDSRLMQMEHEVNNTIKIQTLEAKVAQAKLDMLRYEGAYKSRAATLMELQHARLGHELSVLALKEERFRLRQLALSLKELQAQRDKMYLYAPRDGFVEGILVEQGMAVDRNVTAVHYVSIDPLLVELTLPIEQAMQIQVGDIVEVLQPHTDTAFTGKVTQVARIAVLSSKTLKVGILVDNPQHIAAGLMVTVRFKAPHANDNTEATVHD